MPHWFEEVAEHLGSAYLRYSFTKGTEQEVAFLVDVLGLRPGERVIDVGCGPGRHAAALAERGLAVAGLDISAAFLQADVALPGPAYIRGDARRLPLATGSVDVALSMCEGGFGLVGDEDGVVLGEIARVVKPGGRVAIECFNAYFAVRHLHGKGGWFDAASGVSHEKSPIKSPESEEVDFDLWTSCFTPRELRLMCEANGLEIEEIWAAEPGRFERIPPDLEHPELLVVARKPRGPSGPPGERIG